jgi:hypothetical protein
MILMTQDPQGQSRGTGYVVRGEVVPDDEAQAAQTEQANPMTTRLKKVASALRGDRQDQAAPDNEAPTTSDAQNPNESWPTRPGTAGAVSSPVAGETMDDDEYPDATRPDEAGAVRSPNAGNRGYRDDQPATAQGMGVTNPDAGIDSPDPTVQPAGMRGQTRPEGIGAMDSSRTGADMPGTTAPTGTVPARDPGYGGPGGIAAGYGSQADTAAGSNSQPGTTPGYGSRAGTARSYGTAAGTAAGYGSRADTATDRQGLTGAGAAPGAEAGTAAADAGLRPGEATDRLGDFGDIAFGNLLPDAGQYTARWQQIQFRFVDDPQGSVTEAADVVSQVTTKLEAAIQERQRAIAERQRAIEERASALRGRWGEGSNADTETLRETLRMYRSFMDQLVGPTS